MWDVVPEDTRVLITHTPPAGICNMSSYWKEGRCAALKDKVGHIRPMLPICGIGKRALWIHGSTRLKVPPSKRQSLLDLTAGKAIYSDPRKVGTETAVVNASNQYHGQILQPRAESIQQGHCG